MTLFKKGSSSEEDKPSESEEEIKKIKISIGRLGVGVDVKYVNPDSTIKKILDDNGYELGKNEKVHLNGTKLTDDEVKKTIPTKNSVIAIVGAKEGGIK
jgi:hypothetical protein